MAFNLCDWTWETTTTVGVGSYSLDGRVEPYRPFSAQMLNGDTTYVSVFDGTYYEEGLYTYDAGTNTLARTNVYNSSAGFGNPVNWPTATTKQIMAAQLGITLQSFLTPGSTGIPIRTGDNAWSYQAQLAINRGGTNGTATPTAGAVAYGTGSAYAFTAAGTAGQVLQSTGAGAPAWATPSTGGIGSPGYYAALYDAGADQTAANTTTAYAMRIDSSAEANGVSVASNGSYLSRITVANAGVYTFSPSVQFINPDSSDHDVAMWFRKNGVDVPDSNSQWSVPSKHGGGDGNLVIAVVFTITLAAGDYIEVMWRTSNTQVVIHTYPAGTSPVRPVVPGVIVPVNSQPQIGIGYYNLASTTSTTIGTGSKTFTVNTPSTSSAFTVGTRVRVASSAAPSNWMEGIITAYSGTSLTVNVDTIGGSGTIASWTFSVAGVNNSSLVIGTTTITGGTDKRVLYDNNGVVGEYATTGSGSTVVLSDAPTFQNTPVAPQYRASNGIFVNSQTVTADYTIAAGDSAMSAGPASVASGVTVTISSGSRWVIL